MVSASALTQAEHLQSPLTKAAARCVLVLFGASGDLTKRKLVPALFNLAKANLLPDNFAILGVAFDDLTLEQFRDQVTSFLRADENGGQALNSFRQRLYYQRADFTDSAMYPALQKRLGELDLQYNTEGNYLFYLATAPKFFGQIVQQLGQSQLSKQESGHWRRVVIEKPFGHDLESAKA